MSTQQFLAILLDRRRLAIAVFLGIVTMVVAVSFMLPKRYAASAELIVDMKTQDSVTGAPLPPLVVQNFMASQIDVLQSGRVAKRVVESTRLTENAGWRDKWQRATAGRGEIGAWLVSELRKNVAVQPSRDSNALTLTYTGTDPVEAARMANAFVQAFIDIALQLRMEPARQFSNFYDERARQARSSLEAAQAKLSAYQSKNGIVAIDERFDVETLRLQELSSQLVSLQAQAAETGGRSAAATSNADNLQEVLGHPVVLQLTADLSRYRARLEELQSRLGEQHPQVIEVKASIGELRRRIAAETSRVANSLGVNNRVTQGRLAQVQASLAEQRIKVLRIKQQRDDAAVLEREVESARGAFQAITQRASQAGIESQNSVANVSILEEATEPLRASSPRIMLNTAMGIVIGVMLAVAAVILREMTDRRARTLDDLTQALDVPVLGLVPSMRRKGGGTAAAFLGVGYKPAAPLALPPR